MFLPLPRVSLRRAHRPCSSTPKLEGNRPGGPPPQRAAAKSEPNPSPCPAEPISGVLTARASRSGLRTPGQTKWAPQNG